MTAHEYLSTSCFHGLHTYCQSKTGSNGETEWAKAPACCKFCGAPCVCWCHVPSVPGSSAQDNPGEPAAVFPVSGEGGGSGALRPSPGEFIGSREQNALHDAYHQGAEAERRRIRHRLLACRDCGHVHGDNELFAGITGDHENRAPWVPVGDSALAFLDELLGNGDVP